MSDNIKYVFGKRGPQQCY